MNWKIVHTKGYVCVHGGDRSEIPFADEMYAIGALNPHYPVPALASSSMVLALGWVEFMNIPLTDFAWDGIWIDPMPNWI